MTKTSGSDSTQKRSKVSDLPTQKLQKLIADSGFCSRRKAESLIEAGRVQVDGVVASVGMRVKSSARIFIDNEQLARVEPSETKLLIYHKPAGEVCTRSDPEGRPTVFDRLPRLNKGRWIVIGRLDYNTSGLLLFTNDGDVANQFMHPSNEYEREYMVRVIGEVDVHTLDRLRKGVELEDGLARFDSISASESAGGKNQWFSVVLKEGRNRIVRRLFESQNVTVSRLIRVRFGDISLPRDLAQGKWREHHND